MSLWRCPSFHRDWPAASSYAKLFWRCSLPTGSPCCVPFVIEDMSDFLSPFCPRCLTAPSARFLPKQDFKSATTGVAAKAMRNELNGLVAGIDDPAVRKVRFLFSLSLSLHCQLISTANSCDSAHATSDGRRACCAPGQRPLHTAWIRCLAVQYAAH